MEYLKLKPGLEAGNANKDEAVVIEAISDIAKKSNGELTPAAVLDSASDPKSPLHSYFTWDNTEAAQKWRIHQARSLIASVIIKMEPQAEQVPIRAYVNLKSDDGQGYHHLNEVMKNPVMRQAMLDRALRELEFFQSRYSSLSELSEIWNALGKLKTK